MNASYFNQLPNAKALFVGVMISVGLILFIRELVRGPRPSAEADPLIAALAPPTDRIMMRQALLNGFSYAGLVLFFFLVSALVDQRHGVFGIATAYFAGAIVLFGGIFACALAGLSASAARRRDERLRQRLAELLPTVSLQELPRATIERASFFLRFKNPLLCRVTVQLADGPKTLYVAYAGPLKDALDRAGVALELKSVLFGSTGEHREYQAVFIPQRLLDSPPAGLPKAA